MTLDGLSGSFPAWTPDGKGVVYGGQAAGKSALLLQKVDSLEPPETLVSSESEYGVYPGSWTPDGRTLAIMRNTPTNGGDLAIVDMAGDRTPKVLIATSATEWGAKLSPDGHWIAYVSNESGRWEVYVQPFPGPGSRRQVSNDGGSEVVWARNGHELFYRNGRRMMAVHIDTLPRFTASAPEVLFEGPYASGAPGGHGYDVSVDGQRFLMIKPTEEEASPPIQILLNWFEELKARVPTK